MSSLAFDKQGKPFSFQRRTKKLLVRLFRNQSARGTCCQVMNAEEQPLYIDPETDYTEFRKAVGHVHFEKSLDSLVTWLPRRLVLIRSMMLQSLVLN